MIKVKKDHQTMSLMVLLLFDQKVGKYLRS